MNVLAIDQAAASGWAWFESGCSRPMSSGVAKSHLDRMRVLELMPCYPLEDTVVVFEDHSAMRMRGRTSGGKRVVDTSTSVLLGMGRAHGWWEALLDHVCHDPRARVKCPIAAWKGVCGSGNAAREQALFNAKAFALCHGVGDAQDDEAVAVCMGAWAMRAPEVRAAWERAYGPKARKRRAL